VARFSILCMIRDKTLRNKAYILDDLLLHIVSVKSFAIGCPDAQVCVLAPAI